jgi:NAD-dependent SIR2 family protein deacetylase
MSEKNSKNRVIITGAGFSMSAGIPPQRRLLTDIFTIKAEELTYRDATIRNDRIKLEGFLNFLYGRNWRPENISLEDIYTMVDTAILRQRNIGIFDPSALFKIRESLDRLILYIINKDISPEDIEKYGGKARDLIGTWNTDFISLNWDNLLERVLLHLGYRIDFGVPLERTYEQHRHSHQILVLKPHGSLNWRLCPICENIYVFMEHENIFQCPKCREVYESRREIIEVLQTLDVNFDKGLLPLLVSPTFMKSHSIYQLNIIVQKMYSILTGADEIIFIGYSLPISDHDIRDLLIKSYSIKPEIKVKVILKSSNKAEKTELSRHFISIFDRSSLNFQWNGF